MLKIFSKSPPPRFLFAHPAHLVACGFGSGLSPLAPGSAGSLFALLSFPLLRSSMGEAEFFAFLLVCFAAGIPAVQKTARDYGKNDPGCVVWDEIVPFWFVLAFCPSDWLWRGAAFLLFRFFDIFKPQPARFFDEKVKNGFGIMADDLVAALYTLLVLSIFRLFQ
ncbi:MAG: phosphatidylglycerophosphatase A [Candidatus Accumulibacter sp.]|nr:phosphatidylglycerophosphatase A [Accumulibacter sp.]